MVDKYIAEHILNLSDEEKIKFFCSIGSGDTTIDLDEEYINELVDKVKQIFYNIPDQVKLDAIANHKEEYKIDDNMEQEIMSYIQDDNIRMSYFNEEKIATYTHSNNNLVTAVSFIKDDDERFKYIEKYFSNKNYFFSHFLFDSIDIFKTFSTDKYILQFINTHMPTEITSNADCEIYGKLISCIKDENIKNEIYEKFLDLNKRDVKYFQYVIESFEDDEIKIKHIDDLLNKNYHISDSFSYRKREEYDLVNELSSLIVSLKSDQKKLEYISIIIEQYKYFNAKEVIDSIKDESIRKQAIKSALESGILFSKDLLPVLKKLEDKSGIEDLILLGKEKGSIDRSYIHDYVNLIEDPNMKKKVFIDLLSSFGYNTQIELSKLLNEDKTGKADNIISKMMGLKTNDIKVIMNYYEDREVNSGFKDHIKDLDEFNDSIDLIIKIKNSNSSEIVHISNQIASLILSCPREQRDEKISGIEDIFLKNNIPYVGKIFKVFELMHPDHFVYGTVSPNLNKLYDMNNSTSKNVGMSAIIFSDLLKCAIGSNNRSLIEYVKNIENGNEILKSLIRGEINITDLKGDMKDTFTMYIMHLNALYNNTKEGKENPNVLKENIVKDAYTLLSKLSKDKDFKVDELPNRIVRMFCHFAGIDTIDQLKTLMTKEISEADARNRKRAKENNFTIKEGDFYKGLVNENDDEKDRYYTFLINILQNGSISKEFLGSDARSDTTPLDTDLSKLIGEVPSFEAPFIDKRYAAAAYGPLWLVIKDSDRLNYSQENNEYKDDKLEVFETGLHGAGHFGIRTGFPSSDIDYLVVDEDKVKLYRIYNSIVMNGFYIPVLNTKGNLIFTPEMYDNMRKNLYGLSYFGYGDVYEFSESINDFDSSELKKSIDNNIDETTRKRNLVVNALSSVGLDLATRRDPYMKHGEVELLDIGSTGRGTNTADDYDFDFIMRIDKEIYLDEEKMDAFKKKIEEALPGISFESSHKIREQVVNINGEDVKIDITIIIKDDKIGYTTDECIKDRLSSIEKIDPEQHKKVLENIVLAKQILKENKCYKPKHAGHNKAEGGLGGVGVENWILQHNGSLYDAAKSFMEVANQSTSFDDFKSKYYIFDFGENHLYYRHDDKYMHDNFIADNMDNDGYEKMKDALSKYLKKVEEKNVSSDKTL